MVKNLPAQVCNLLLICQQKPLTSGPHKVAGPPPSSSQVAASISSLSLCGGLRHQVF